MNIKIDKVKKQILAEMRHESLLEIFVAQEDVVITPKDAMRQLEKRVAKFERKVIKANKPDLPTGREKPGELASQRPKGRTPKPVSTKKVREAIKKSWAEYAEKKGYEDVTGFSSSNTPKKTRKKGPK